MIVLCLNFWRTSIVFHRLTLSKADQPHLKAFQHLQIRSKPLPSLKGPCMIWPPLLPPPLLLTLLWPHWPLYCSRNKQNGIPPKATAPPVLSAWEAFPQDPPTAPSSLPFGSQPEGPLLKAAFPWLLSSRSPLQHQFFVKKIPLDLVQHPLSSFFLQVFTEHYVFSITVIIILLLITIAKIYWALHLLCMRHFLRALHILFH